MVEIYTLTTRALNGSVTIMTHNISFKTLELAEKAEEAKEAAAAEPAKGKTNIEKVMLTTNGVDVSNYVFADFLL